MAEKENNNNFFGKFDNKYVRGGAAALIAAYVAKEDPYLLEGFAEGLEEKQKADRETRNAIIKAATDAKMRFKAEDLKRRKKRRADVEPSIKMAKENGINPVVAAKASEAGMLDTLIKFKIANPTYDVNALYTVSEDYKDKVSGLTHSQIIESLVGKGQKYNEIVDSVQAPKITNPLRKFVQGTDRDTDIVSDIKTRFAAMDVEKEEDIVDVDLSKIQPTTKGQELMAKFLGKDEKTKTQTERDLKNFTSSFMNIELKYDRATGENVFSSDDINNVKYANLVTKHFVNEVESMVKDPNSPAFMNREVALSLINNKYLEYNDDTGLREIRFDKINEQYDNPIIPEGWTPSTTTKQQIAKSKGKKESGGDGDGKKVTTSGNKTIDKIVKQWNKDKLDRYEAYGKNKNNSQYKRFVRIQGKAKQKEIEALGGNPNLISLEY